MSARLASLAALLALSACSRSGDPALETVSAGPALPIDHPSLGADAGLSTAPPGRVSVAQLRGILPVAMGNELDGGPITWRLGPNPALDVLSAALGEANYLQSTEDDLSPSPVYVKFIDDLARDVCARSLNADYARPAAAERALLRHVDRDATFANAPAQVDKNLRYLKLRFHGVRVPNGDDAPISALRTVFVSAVTAAAVRPDGGAGPTGQTDVKEGWRAVCVALVTAPEFHLY